MTRAEAWVTFAARAMADPDLSPNEIISLADELTAAFHQRFPLVSDESDEPPRLRKAADIKEARDIFAACLARDHLALIPRRQFSFAAEALNWVLGNEAKVGDAPDFAEVLASAQGKLEGRLGRDV